MDLREALTKCRESRARLSLQGFVFDAWTELLEAMAAKMAEEPLCPLCAADMPHSDSVCFEHRQRRVRGALKDLVEAIDLCQQGRDQVGLYQARDDEKFAAALAAARAVLEKELELG